MTVIIMLFFVFSSVMQINTTHIAVFIVSNNSLQNILRVPVWTTVISTESPLQKHVTYATRIATPTMI